MMERLENAFTVMEGNIAQRLSSIERRLESMETAVSCQKSDVPRHESYDLLHYDYENTSAAFFFISICFNFCYSHFCRLTHFGIKRLLIFIHHNNNYILGFHVT